MRLGIFCIFFFMDSTNFKDATDHLGKHPNMYGAVCLEHTASLSRDGVGGGGGGIC